MSLEVGDIVEGKVTGITGFGAFVALPEGDDGLVHISEMSDDYVEKVDDYITKGQELKVKVISIAEDGKIGLSIKQAGGPKLEKKVQVERPRPERKTVEENSKSLMEEPRELNFNRNQKSDGSFEDMMSQFLKDSNERHSDIKARENKRGPGAKSNR